MSLPIGTRRNLSDQYFATSETYRSPNPASRFDGQPTVRVWREGTMPRPTPGSWFAETIAARTPGGRIAIDFGAGWLLSESETEALRLFAIEVQS